MTLSTIARHLGCERIILSLNDTLAHRALISKSVGWDNHWMRERERHLPEIHRALAAWPSIDIPFVSSRHMPEEVWAQSPYVAECLNPLGVCDVAHYFLIKTNNRFSEMVVFRQQQLDVLSDDEIALGNLLVPHLRQALTMSNIFEGKSARAGMLAKALGSIASAVFIVDARAEILFTNPAGEEALKVQTHVRSDHGRLRLASRSGEDEWLRALKSVCGTSATASPKHSVEFGSSDGPRGSAHLVSLDSCGGSETDWPGAEAVVFINTGSREKFAVDAAARAFRLSPAETLVVAGLLAGRTLADLESDMSIARTTIKTHLDNIFTKTGVRRQADLIRLVLSSEPTLNL